MEIRQIRYVLAVAKSYNFTKAAEELYITQQTLSQQIKSLEDELGFNIFERTTRSVSPTRRGKIFIERAQPILDVFDSFSHEIEALQNDTIHSIRFGILPTFSHLNILETIYDFQAHEKDVSVQVQIQKSNRLVSMMENNVLDIAIGNLSQMQIETMDKNYEIHILSRDSICAIMNCTHPYAQKEIITFSELKDQNLLLLEKGSSIRERIGAELELEKIRPSKIYDCPEIHSMVGMLHSGTGIGFLSSQVAQPFLSDTLVSIPLIPKMETITALYFRKSENNTILKKAAQYFLKHL